MNSLYKQFAIAAALFLLAIPGAAQNAAILDGNGLTLTNDQGNNVPLSPSFSSTQTQYTATVAYSVVYVEVEGESSADDVYLLGTDSMDKQGHQIALNRGGTTTINVEARASGKTTTRYTVVVTSTAASTDAKLDGLTLTPGDGISPAFAEDTKSYSARVANLVTSITVTPTLPDGATVTFNKTNSGTNPNVLEYALPVGTTTIQITVTAEDGRTRETYTIEVTRAVEQSKDATLQTLTVSSGTLSPAFDPLTTSYTASVANSVASVTVTADPTISGATATIEEADATDGEEVTLTAGETKTVTILVTATDETTTKTYTLRITRAGSSSTDATLRSLTVSSGTLSPAFDKEETAYTVGVANSVESVRVTANPTVSGATATIDGDDATDGHLVTLVAGTPKTVTITVTATDGSTTKDYTVAVTRTAAAANDATLSRLTLSAGTLDPVFSPARESYTAEVYYEVDEITVTPTVNASGATVAYTPSTDADDSTPGHQVTPRAWDRYADQYRGHRHRRIHHERLHRRGNSHVRDVPGRNAFCAERGGGDSFPSF